MASPAISQITIKGDTSIKNASVDLRKAASGGPEKVNDGTTTAPSKRLLAQSPAYRKTIDGPLAIAEFGLDGLRGQCPHLDEWVRRVETWGGHAPA